MLAVVKRRFGILTFGKVRRLVNIWFRPAEYVPRMRPDFDAGPVVIRSARWKPAVAIIAAAVIHGALVFFFLTLVRPSGHGVVTSWCIAGLGIVLLGLFIQRPVQLITHPSRLILSSEGVTLQSRKSKHWTWEQFRFPWLDLGRYRRGVRFGVAKNGLFAPGAEPRENRLSADIWQISATDLILVLNQARAHWTGAAEIAPLPSSRPSRTARVLIAILFTFIGLTVLYEAGRVVSIDSHRSLRNAQVR